MLRLESARLGAGGAAAAGRLVRYNTCMCTRANLEKVIAQLCDFGSGRNVANLYTMIIFGIHAVPSGVRFFVSE